ncbi:predicted protein [Histoplasma capsulatum H143]|uniref:Uncharacterized protein n=1 Tax=Ajellomyces capsulatus (strain H143) TaxID=544712 RepID=C6HA80_AJECH|nr:predicted protein [Histoplasma capsulatum H143]
MVRDRVVSDEESSPSWDFARVPALLAQGPGFFSQAQARLKVRGPTQQQGQSAPTGPAASALAEAANQAKGVQWLQWNVTASDRARLPSAAATAGTMALGGTRLGTGCWLAGDRATSPAAPPRGSMGPWGLLRPASDWLQTGFRPGPNGPCAVGFVERDWSLGLPTQLCTREGRAMGNNQIQPKGPHKSS